MDYKKFYGPKKISRVEDAGLETRLGDNVCRVFFEDNTSLLLSEKTLRHFTTDKTIDLTGLQEMKFNVMINQVLDIMFEFNIQAYELKAFAQRIADDVQDIYDRATSFAWTGDDKNYVQGAGVVAQRSLLEAHEVLMQIPSYAEAQSKRQEKSND